MFCIWHGRGGLHVKEPRTKKLYNMFCIWHGRGGLHVKEPRSIITCLYLAWERWGTCQRTKKHYNMFGIWHGRGGRRQRTKKYYNMFVFGMGEVRYMSKNQEAL